MEDRKSRIGMEDGVWRSEVWNREMLKKLWLNKASRKGVKI